MKEWRSEAQELRSCYVALNTLAPQYLAALTDHLNALGRDEDLRSMRRRPAEVRDLYRDVYAEAQMRVPERVLELAGDLSHDLGVVFGMVRRLDDGVARAGDSPVVVQDSLDALWGRLREARRETRAEPGASRADFGR
ncbi:hypothetical protein N4G69_44210 [Streptomyces mirabilis]|uniref:hypothetical protein n=1 Tax=Streptomyces mirabilis TaxID=68239 RepID=UPI0021C0B220|nr:hypothetical protein [Streptomyces mirabilis]MCT9112506.1 hypothetical protein [Streptomyces mirabilis]